MIAILNGSRGGTINYINGSDDAIEALLLDDDGTPIDLTGDTVTLEVYAKSDRSDTPTSLSGTLTAATAGHVTFTIADDSALASLSNKSYYAWVKRVASGGAVDFGNEFTQLVLK